VTYGRWCFWINSKPKESKVSRYDTLKQVEKSLGRVPPELENAPKLSDSHIYAWEAFLSLSDFTWLELKAYMELTNTQLEQWEIKAVMELAKYREAEPVWPLK